MQKMVMQKERITMKLDFVCPTCKKELKSQCKKEKNNGDIVCLSCKEQYKNNYGIYDFVPKNLVLFKQREAVFHSNIVDSYYDTAQLDTLRNKEAHNDFLEPLKSLSKSAKILELGCGLGQDGRILMQEGICVVQSDISPKTLQKAKRKAVEQDLHNNAFILMDSENIPFPDNYFDATFMVASLHHMMNPEKALAEMKRCTKQDGLIVIGIEPNKWEYYVIFPFIRFRKKYIKKADNYSPGDETTVGFNKHSFKKMATKLNLTITKISPVWYVNGIIHIGAEALFRVLHLKKRIKLPVQIEKFFCSVDKAVSYIPLLKEYPWHWNVIMKK